MSILLNLSPELEAKLRKIALSSGKSIEALAAEILGNTATPSFADADDTSTLSLDEWNRTLDHLLATLPKTSATDVDTHRDRIYADDGR